MKNQKQILNEILCQLKLNPNLIFLNSEYLKKLQFCSILPNGFLNNFYRKEIYKYLYCLKENNEGFVGLFSNIQNNNNNDDDNKNENIKINFFEDFININELNNKNINYINNKNLRNEKFYDGNIINNDISRTIGSNINQNKFDYLNKNYLSNYLLFSKNTIFKYNYYQGCLDILTYFMELFKKNNNFGLSITQKYFEIYMKDFLNENFDMNVINEIVFECIKIIDFDIYKKLYEINENLFTFRIHLILTTFCHEDKYLEGYVYRLFDYILTHKAYMIFIIVGYFVVLLAEDVDLNDENIEIDDIFNYSIENINFDTIIYLSNNFINDKNKYKLFELNIIEKYKNNFENIFKYKNGIDKYLNYKKDEFNKIKSGFNSKYLNQYKIFIIFFIVIYLLIFFYFKFKFI